MKKTAILFFALSTLLIGTAGAFAQKRLLEDTSWKLVEADGRLVKQTDAEITFDRQVAGFSGNTGCNSMSGSVDIRGKNIDFGPVRTTRRMCKLMAGSVAENVVLEGLDKARRFDIRGDALRLYDRRGRTVLRFKRSVGDNGDDGSAQLENRKWVLEQIKGRQTFAPLPYAFLNFDAKKHSAGGNSSCNVFGGGYKVSGNTILFSNIMSTMRACVEEDSKMSTERDMLDGLRDANRYEIRDGRLFLYRDRQLLLTFRGDRK